MYTKMDITNCGSNQSDMQIFYEHHLRMAPIRIEMELTESCNMRCRFCYNTLTPVFIDTAMALELLKKLSAQGILEIVLTGGEPTLHPDFIAIANSAGNLFTNVMLQTNGTLLTRELVTLIKESGFLGLNISIHGKESVHDRLTTIEGSYDDALRALELSLKASLVTWVNMVLTNENKSTLSEHLTNLKSHGVRNFTFTRFTPVGSGRDADLALSVHDLVEVVADIDTFRQNNTDCTVLLANAVPRCTFPDDLVHYAEPCSYGISRFYINVKGDLMICGMSRIILGNTLRQSIEEIKRNSEEYRSICLGVALPPTCKACSDMKLCRGGCRAAAWAVTGKLDGLDPLAKSREVSI